MGQVGWSVKAPHICAEPHLVGGLLELVGQVRHGLGPLLQEVQGHALGGLGAHTRQLLEALDHGFEGWRQFMMAWPR